MEWSEWSKSWIKARNSIVFRLGADSGISNPDRNGPVKDPHPKRIFPRRKQSNRKLGIAEKSAVKHSLKQISVGVEVRFSRILQPTPTERVSVPPAGAQSPLCPSKIS
jgi:hypothetical protein